MPSFVSAQIIIKEKVEVNPQSVIIPDNPIQGHTVRVDIEWIPSNVEGSIIFYDLYCTTPNSAWSGTSSTGSLSFSHTKNGYEYYHIQFRFYPCTLFPYPQPHNIQGTYTIYYDGRFMKTAPFQIEGVCGSGGGNAIYNTAFRPPLVTDYQFKITTENFCYGSSGNILVLGTANYCSNSFEIDTSVNKTLKLEILDGKEFASFYQNGEKKDTATIRYDNLDYWGYYIKDISIMADSVYTGSQPQNVIIKSNWADEIRLDTITILHQIPTQIYVSDDQPIIVRYGTSGIQVKTNSSYGSDSCWAEMPDSVKYKAVIIKGQNLGNLFDYNTGNAGDMLINLSHNNGQIVIGFVTEGENLTEVDTVIVSISTTDPNINTVQAMLLIKPNDINVTIIPGTISQGDTARVVLKKNGQNGLEPFPPDKLFNVQIVNGTEYGLILDSLSNDTLTTFENILQGFKIIAKDSTGIDSTKIRIKVTTEEEITLPAVRLTKEKQIEEIQNKSQTKQDKEGELIEAFIGDPGAPILIEGFGDVVVKNEDWCTSLTKCDGEINLPQVVLNPVPNGYNGRDICTDRPEGGDPLEGVQVFWNEDLSITTDICYNSYQERVWYSDTSPLNINYTLAICDQNVPSGVNLIDDWTGLDNGLTCDQLEDIFRAMTIYGGRAMPPLPGYYLRVVINAHENEHKIDYQTAIDQALPEFNQTLQNYIKHCVDFNDKESAKLVFSKFISQSFSKLKENSKNNIKKIKKSGNNRSLDYETDVQRRRSVIDEINRQISATNTAWNCNILLIDYFY